MRSRVHAAITMKVLYFRIDTIWSGIYIYQRLRGSFWLHLQERSCREQVSMNRCWINIYQTPWCHISVQSNLQIYVLVCRNLNSKQRWSWDIYLLGYNAVWFAESQPTFRRNKYSTCYLLHTGFLLDLFFDPEHGDDMFLRKFHWIF
jgi:hypothetical protein